MSKFELVNQWENGLVEPGLYTSYVLDEDTNIIVQADNESITLKFLEQRFTRCETYYKGGMMEEYFE